MDRQETPCQRKKNNLPTLPTPTVRLWEIEKGLRTRRTPTTLIGTRPACFCCLHVGEREDVRPSGLGSTGDPTRRKVSEVFPAKERRRSETTGGTRTRTSVKIGTEGEVGRKRRRTGSKFKAKSRQNCLLSHIFCQDNGSLGYDLSSEDLT